MSKIHYCSNGISVTDQVLTYLNTKANSDYIPIQQYYDDFKTHWYKQLSDYMDRATFDAEYDYRLCQAVLKFKVKTAKKLAKKNKWSTIGMFNRWFYRCLIHWCLNIKTSSIRLKKRPPVQCPVCGKMVAKINEEHLEHYKTVKDIPLVFSWNGVIYETATTPARYAVCWGEESSQKLEDLESGKFKLYRIERKQVKWPWKIDKDKAVVCPFTNKIVSKIDSDYIRSLSNKHSRYAEHMTWSEFTQRYPMVLIQAEIYSLDYGNKDDSSILKNALSAKSIAEEMDHDAIKSGRISPKYEHTFKIIDEIADNDTVRDILKLSAIGYTVDDIADTLNVEKKNIKQSLAAMRTSPFIKSKLLD